MRTRWTAVIAIILMAGVSPAAMLHAQVRSPIELRSQLRERFDIVALRQGVAFVPRESRPGIRLIELVEGVVSVDGETLTGRQLRDRLGRDADLILQVSYLAPDEQRALAGSDVPAAEAGSSDPSGAGPSAERDDAGGTRVSDGDRVRIGGPVSVARGERIEGNVVAIMGSADIDGEVTGEVTVVMGPLNLGQNAVVRGDVTVVGGALNRAPGAQVLGRVNEVAVGGTHRGGPWSMAGMFGSAWSRVGSLAATILRIALVVLLGLVAIALGRSSIERIAARTVVSPLRAGLVGLAAEILFLPVLVITVIVLAVSIVGIPLLVLVPFAVLAVALLAFVGFIGLAYHIGGLLTARFGWSDRGGYAAVAIGVVAVAGVTLFAKLAALAGGFIVGAPLMLLGCAIEYVAWTIGFGATILAWYETQGRSRSQAPMAPPPLPTEG